MCRWFIHTWRIWLHCIILTCGFHFIPLHYNSNCICIRPHTFCLEHIQCLLEYHFTQPQIKSISQFTISISGLVQEKMAKTSISLNKLEGIMNSGNKVNTGNKPDRKFWYDLLESIFITLKMIRSSSDNVVLSWVYNNYK